MRIRQLFRFKLRTLMVLGLILCVGLGVLGRQALEARRQRAVVASLGEQGAIVFFNDVEPSLPEWLDTCTSRVDILVINGMQIRDFAVIVEFKGLQTLNLNNTQVSDLSPLRGLVNLRNLHVSASVTGAQVRSLEAALPNCRIIHTP